MVCSAAPALTAISALRVSAESLSATATVKEVAVTSVTSTHEASASAFHSGGLACTSMVRGLFPSPRKAQAASLSRTYCVSDTPSVLQPVSSRAVHTKGKAART